MRHAAKVDANQPDIVKGLRAVGASVQHIYMIGQGCPDILVGYRGRNYLMEIKDGSAPPSQRRLTDDETKWINKWRGNVAIVETLETALLTIGAV